MQNFVTEIFSDSSLTGWGSYCNGLKTFGFWNKQEKKYHINYLELLAAFFAVKCFASELSQCEVLLRIDNTTAISYINRAGGVQFPHLSELLKKIWAWCEEREIWLKASYIPSSKNIEADKASRNVNVDSEWEISQEAFTQIEEQFGFFTVDLFATRLNKKCKRFYSRFPDPEAEAVDAFTISWKNEHFYTFPPFALILRTLKKIINDKAIGTVIVPLWPTQPWYPLFTALLIEPAIIFKPNSTLLTSPYRDESHPLASHLSLVAGRLSGYDINKDGLIHRFLKGAFKRRPTKPKYSTTWDITPVLNYMKKLHPLKQLKLKDAVEKVATLLALTTAQRLQTLALINIDNIEINSTGISIRITEQIKTSKPGAFQPDLILPFFKEKPELCIVSAVLDYIDYTKVKLVLIPTSSRHIARDTQQYLRPLKEE
ncbi:PREDICTED: uncharacterized protein LOC105557794 [Vollenhovia emeryi]|uniref:uncharacterized protein LOC105557794 n=1 Tax=Vollenhovia emeryi TaxID=411798 RepID=UPI0005F3660B|nr:PREDICTED: uncharacterized protein LOC105557794 [Vollenhovia emeryi]